MTDEIKKRGRPPLSDEERERRRKEKNKRDNERKKEQGWVTQKKYHTEVVDTIKITIPKGGRDIIKQIAEDNNTSMTAIIVDAVEEKYGVKLR